MSLMKKLTSLIVTSSLVLGLVGTSFAAFGPEAVQEAADRMVTLGLVQGMPGGDLALNSNLTRAQLVTIIVRAYGQEDNAKLMAEAPTKFPDVAGHWASGYIWMANSLITQAGHSMGMPDGTFNPDGNVTVAEAVAFLLKFLGVPIPANTAWPAGYLQIAAGAGLVSAADAAMLSPILNSPATRGMAFWMSDSAFYNYNLADGKTVYTKYVSKDMPTLTVDAVDATTTATSVTITGTTNATTVYVGNMDNMALLADGAFSADVELALGANDIVVHAVSLAGNHATKTVKVTRTAGAAATIDAPATLSVAAGATVDLAAMVKDANGAEIADAEITAEGTIGAFADGKFTAATTAGTGNLVLKSGDATATVAVTVTAGALAALKADTSTVAVGGKAVITGADAYGNKVEGVVFSIDSTDANVGASNGVFIASKAGNYVVTGTKGDATATLTIGVYGAAAKLVVSAPATAVGNGSTKYDVTVKVVDANGNVVSNSAGVDLTLTAPVGTTAYLNDGTTAGATATGVKNGMYTFKVAYSAGLTGQMAEFSATSSPAITSVTKGSTEVTGQVASSVKVAYAGSAKYLLANTVTTQGVAVTVLDQMGVAMISGTYSAKLTIDGPATFGDGTKESTLPITVSGTASVNIQSVQGFTGPVTVTATVDGIGTASAGITAAVSGTAKNIVVTAANSKTTAKATETLTYTVSFTDANGIPTTDGAPTTVTLDFGTTDLTNITVVDGASNDIKTSKTVTIATSPTFVIGTSAKFTGNLPLTVKATGYNSAAVAVNFTAGAEAAVQLDRTAISVPAADPKATVNAQLYDVKGNKVAKAGIELTLAVTSGTAADVTVNGTAETYTAKTDANGAAAFEIVTRPFSGNTYTLTVTGKVDNTGAALVNGTNGAVAVAVKTSTPASISVALFDYTTGNSIVSATAGQQIYVRATVKDNYGANLAGEAGNLVLSAEKVLWNGSALVDGTGVTFGTTGTVGVYDAIVTVGKAGLQSLTVKNSTGQNAVSGSRSVNVASTGVLASFHIDGVTKVSNASYTFTASKSTVTGPYTVQLADAYGNPISVGVATTVTVTSAPGVAIRASQAGADLSSFSTYGAYSFYIAAGATPGTPFNITLTSGSVTATIAVTIQ